MLRYDMIKDWCCDFKKNLVDDTRILFNLFADDGELFYNGVDFRLSNNYNQDCHKLSFK